VVRESIGVSGVEAVGCGVECYQQLTAKVRIGQPDDSTARTRPARGLHSRAGALGRIVSRPD